MNGDRCIMALKKLVSSARLTSNKPERAGVKKAAQKKVLGRKNTYTIDYQFGTAHDGIELAILTKKGSAGLPCGV